MAVAKRQGRENPAKIEQKRSKEGLRTRVRTSGRTALLTKPSLHRAGQGEEKNHKKRSQRASLSLSRVHTFFLSHSIHPHPHPTARWPAPPLSSLLRGWILLLSSK